MLNVTVNREVASSFGILPSTIDNTLDDAFGQRIVSTMFTSLNQYHVMLEVDPRFQSGPEALHRHLSELVERPAGPAEHVGQQHIKRRANRDQPPEHVSVGHDLVQPEARRGAGRCGGGRSSEFEKRRGKPASLITIFQGNAQAFQSSLSGKPLLIARGADRDLHHPRRAL